MTSRTALVRTFARCILALLFAIAAVSQSVRAQAGDVWIQVEARPSLTAAQDRARFYAGSLNDVNGFALDTGWYGIALGPYSSEDAEALSRQLLRDRLIPSDSFIADGSQFERRFWPVGNAAFEILTPEPEAQPEPQIIAEPEPRQVPEPQPTPVVQVEETPSQARAIEAQLTRREREKVQTALEWADVYEGAIDGLFGRGTRNAMAEWQARNGYQTTGIMTSAQRDELLTAYDAVLDGLGMQTITEDVAGIRLDMPMGAVQFEAYAPPFVRYTSDTIEEAQILLISQPGDQDRLFGLYEIMQTLDIVPEDGDRKKTDIAFRIEGANNRISSFTLAELRDGRIKGFTLVWPAGDEQRRSRLLAEMRASFEFLPGVLEPSSASNPEDQVLGQIAGLDLRRPRLSRSGFYIDTAGTVLTTPEAVAGCERITLDRTHDAQIAFVDDALGLAVLRPVETLAPPAVAQLRIETPRIGDEMTVSGYPYEGILNAPTLTFGTLADIRGLQGETDRMRLDMSVERGTAGGPVFDRSGAVVGLLLPASPDGGTQLPDGVGFFLDAAALDQRLKSEGFEIAPPADRFETQSPERLTKAAPKLTVLVSCWD
ncbi:trypsin-like peptidase domain-containing protein [Aestuariibius insulae]|uniref:trypsin-like peptidase domain-containing protein n=1 Tax=Aestuariibius insulae TaxID=2058287 RepID=UPI00398E36C4